jgi:hypothetical protein
MSRLRKIIAAVAPGFMVYALVVAGIGVMDCTCEHKNIDCKGHEAALCFKSHAQADCAVPYHHDQESQGMGLSNSCCHCSILPVSMAPSYVPAFGALTSLICMQGVARTPCFADSVVDSGIGADGIRPPPASLPLNPAIASLQSILLIV